MGCVKESWYVINLCLSLQLIKVPQIGFLKASSPFSLLARTEVFRGLRELGYPEAQNIVIEYRDTKRENSRLPALAVQLVLLTTINSHPCQQSLTIFAGKEIYRFRSPLTENHF